MTPWPRYSGNTNIPGNGAQTVKAIREFETSTKPPLAPAGGGGGGTTIQFNNNSGGGGAGAPAGGGS